MSHEPAPDSGEVVGPSGRTYRLAPDSLPPLQRALANREVTRAYLLDLIESVRASTPPELFPTQVVGRLGQALRALPPSWLREYAYAGMLAVLLDQEDEQQGPGEGA
jgi:hypothetical protein